MDSICKSCEYLRICGRKIIGSEKTVMTGCSRYKERKPITNADRIRAMTDEELAEWLDNVCKSAYDEGYTKKTGEPLMPPYPSTASEWSVWLGKDGE